MLPRAIEALRGHPQITRHTNTHPLQLLCVVAGQLSKVRAGQWELGRVIHTSTGGTGSLVHVNALPAGQQQHMRHILGTCGWKSDHDSALPVDR